MHDGADRGGVSIVVPVFNSADTIAELHERIAAAISSVPGLSSWELILVDDGSADSSWERIAALSEEHAPVRGLGLGRNLGQHNALLAGIHAARYEVIVTLDDDLQNPPEEIPRLLEALGPDLDVVYGAPIAKHHPAYRRIGSIAVRAFLRVLTGDRALLLATGFRAFRAELATRLPEASGRPVNLDSLLRVETDRFGSISVTHEPRRSGRSNYTFPMLIKHALTEIATDLRLRYGQR
jgi:glycosyltransferase involved in cell wall biosynthesis